MRLLLTSLLLVSVSLVAQPPQGKKGGGPPKNLKLLDPNSDYRATMQTFVKALGASGCTFCHVQGDFASDDNPKKVTARMMIQMARDINAKFPDGGMHVRCWTCHRGSATPETEPPAN